jgi:diguanylate cyclase (GGDEF)-like protein
MRRSVVAALAGIVGFLAAGRPALSRVDEPRPLGPQVLTFAHYGLEEGLDSLATMDLELDPAGTLWIATQEGVVRYDGDRFLRFGREGGLPSPVVFDVEEDGAGALWAGTLRGLARFDGSRFVPVELPGSPAGEAVEALALDAKGRLVAGAAGGAWRCDAAACSRIFSTLPSEFVSTLALDPTSGELWFAGSFGLVRWRERELERYTEAQGLPSRATRALLVDRYGTLWLRQVRSLVRFDTGEGTFAVETDLPPASDVSRLFQDRRGVVWVTSDRGLFHKEGARWLPIGAAEGLPDDAVTAVAEDQEGALWVGTAYEGVARWLGRDSFSTWNRSTGLPGDAVWAVSRGSDGTLAVGTSAGLALASPDGRSLRVLGREQGFTGEHVLSLAPGAGGGFWVGSTEGKLAWVGSDGRVLDLAARSRLPEDLSTHAIAVTDGSTWLATSSGLWRGDGSPQQVVFRPVVVPGGAAGASSLPEIFFDLLVERSGVLWAAGRHGLARFDGREWKRWTRADGLRDDFLLSLAEDGAGALWIGYRDAHGVSIATFDGDHPRFEHLDRRQGLRHDQVTFVRRDALGRIWVGTTRGLSVRTGERFANFGRSDGLASEDTCPNAFRADADGTVWVGTSRGLVAARVSREGLRPLPSLAARVLRFTLGGARYEARASPRVGFDDRTFSIDFAARTFRAPQEVEFRYRLIGVDAESVVTAQRSARYPSLPSGRHRFEVAARFAGGLWGPAATVGFEILPPWWSTLPARLGLLLLMALAGLGVDRLRSRRVRRRSDQLQEAVDARTRELRDSQEELARKNDELAHLSQTDALTGLKNRRYAWEYLAREVGRVDREWAAAPPDKEPDARLVFFLADVDLFKSINDQHGHEVGDRILIEASERVREATRLSDVAVRWGGEEFLVVARDLPRAEWRGFASRLRDAISKEPYLPSPESGPVTCTASLGYAAYPFDRATALEWHQVLRLADLALYAVKQTGRNADLGVEPGGAWSGKLPVDLLASQASGAIHLRWSHPKRARR